MKQCNKCLQFKLEEMYHKYRYNGNLLRKSVCRDCINNNRKKYYSKNSEKIINLVSKYKKNNRKKINDRDKERRINDVTFKLQELVRSVIKQSIKRNGGIKGGKSVLKYLAYTSEELKFHLESQFEFWMTWNNHGLYDPSIWDDNNFTTWIWQIDHIIPQADLPYTNMEDENFKKCWSLENLRPLSAKQNIIDGSSRVRHINKKAA
jgi:hypothetical protein